MKNGLTALAITISILFAYNSKAQEQVETPEPFEVVDIGGSVTFDDEGLEGVTIELFEGNNVVDAIDTKKNGKFKFTLMSEHIYTLELRKKGYWTKRISVNTKMPEGYDDTYKFMFDLGLESKQEKKLDKNLAEYPAVLIAFDKKKDAFTFDKNYTETYVEEIEVSNSN